MSESIHLQSRPTADGNPRCDGVEPSSDLTQRRLIELASEVLSCPVQPSDNFFDAGGNSLLAMRLVARIEAQLRIKLDLFTCDSTNMHLMKHWKPLVRGGVRCHRVPGAHMELLNPENLSSFVPVLEKVLQTAQARPSAEFLKAECE